MDTISVRTGYSITPSAVRYSVDETNGLDIVGHDYHDRVDYAEPMTLAQVAEAGGKITRLRVLGGGPSDGFYADISYVHATLPDGRIVPLREDYPMCFPIRMLKRELVRWAQEHGVFAKGLGLLDEANWSILR